jgi:Uncharacterised MFS-type transporter YbfB
MYALNGIGWMPHMVFLVDFVARGMGKGVQIGSEFWVVFGIAAIAKGQDSLAVDGLNNLPAVFEDQ